MKLFYTSNDWTSFSLLGYSKPAADAGRQLCCCPEASYSGHDSSLPVMVLFFSFMPLVLLAPIAYHSLHLSHRVLSFRLVALSLIASLCTYLIYVISAE